MMSRSRRRCWRCSGIKRSLIAEAHAYRAAYLYRWLKEPALQVTPQMSYAEFNDAFENRLKAGIGDLLSAGPTDQPFDTGEFDLPIAAVSDAPPGEHFAILDTSGPLPVITFACPLQTPPFAGLVSAGR